MLDSLTLAPVHSKNESPLFFFSITTSSGKPKPAEDTRQQPGNISVSLSYTVFILYIKKTTQATVPLICLTDQDGGLRFTFYSDGVWYEDGAIDTVKPW